MLGHSSEITATVLFALAVLHTFSTTPLRKLSRKYPKGSVQEGLLHLLSEVEVVFGIWAGVLFGFLCALNGIGPAIEFVETLNFTEPLFVFAIMIVAASKPVLELSERLILGMARIVPIKGEAKVYFSVMVFGPLLGSFITEPAAMTVTALLLKKRYYDHKISDSFKYFSLALLFVNVSIGGAMTHFAAPPILMVAAKWNWDLAFMAEHFAWKVALGVLLNASLIQFVLRAELRTINVPLLSSNNSPAWVSSFHILILGLIVMVSHHPVIFLALFLFFLGFVGISKRYQSPLHFRESLLVSFFLAGLVVLGSLQKWWLAPLLASLNKLALFVGSTALTAVTDNAALTYLGSQVEGLPESYRYALVAGAIAGGGLTVIANAPNPVAYSILQDSFGAAGIKAGKLFLAALLPTLIAMACLWIL